MHRLYSGKKYIQAEILEPTNNDLMINTHHIDVVLAVLMFEDVFNSRHWYDYSLG
jgi:hypothetical protein